QTGYTTGKVRLCTPPDKDVGFPYNSEYGSAVDKRMLDYSWQAYKILIDRSSYSDWIDSGKLNPTHEEWGMYLKDVIEPSMKDRKTDNVEILANTRVESITPEDGRVKITTVRKISAKREKEETTFADGVVLSGPGEPRRLPNMPANAGNLI